MLANIYWLLLIPIFIPLIWFAVTPYAGKQRPSIISVAAAIIVGCLVMSGIWQTSKYSQMADTEIWTGEITDKEQVAVSCVHSYDCPPCSTDEDGHETCDTCYEHSYDYDWDVSSTAGNFTIARIDRQGIHPPPRWSKITKGQPASREHSYDNYVQAVPSSIYHVTAPNDASLPIVPKYPRVHDYHHVHRVLSVGVNVPDIRIWNEQISMALRKLGPQKQVNIIVVIANTEDPKYRYKVEAAWDGGNKNDAIVLIGVNETLDVSWVDVITFTKNTGNELFQKTMINTITEAKTMDGMIISKIITNTVEELFDRPQMADLEYLKDAIEPPLWVVIIAIIFSVLAGIGVLLWVNSRTNGGYRNRRTY